MIGTVGKLGLRTGGYIIPSIVDNTDSEECSLSLPVGSKILCSNCQIQNEESLISDGSLIKTSIGYDIKSSLDLTIIREKANKAPLTILHGREILYSDYVTNSDGELVFNLPKGARINKTLVSETGEFIISTIDKILIEY